MDPFSIIVGTAGLADVCIRLTKFLKQAKDGFQKIDEDLEDLSKEITELRTVSDLIKRSFEADLAGTANSSDNQVIVKQWQATRTTLAGCQEIVERLNALMTTIMGMGGAAPKHVKFNNLRKDLKQQSKEDEFAALRKKLGAHHIALQTSLAAVNVYVFSVVNLDFDQITVASIYTRNSQSTSNESFSELSQKIQMLGADLQGKIASLQADIETSAERNVSHSNENFSLFSYRSVN